MIVSIFHLLVVDDRSICWTLESPSTKRLPQCEWIQQHSTTTYLFYNQHNNYSWSGSWILIQNTVYCCICVERIAHKGLVVHKSTRSYLSFTNKAYLYHLPTIRIRVLLCITNPYRRLSRVSNAVFCVFTQDPSYIGDKYHLFVLILFLYPVSC